MGQFWTWNYSVTNAIASAMFAGTTQAVLGILDLWTYPDVRFARLQNEQDEPSR